MRHVPRSIAVLTVVVLGLAGCGTDDDAEDDATTPAGTAASTAAETTSALETVDASVPSDPEAPAQSATEQSDLGVVLGSLPLPPGSAPLGQAVSEGDNLSQTFTVQGIASASDVLDDDYLATLQDDDWDEDEPVEDRGDGVAATYRRGEVELLLVAQDGPADDPENAVLNVVLSGDVEG